MIELDLSEIIKATGGSALNAPEGALPIKGITLDSRKAEPGALFIALKGEHSDGHDYIPAIAGSIAAAVTERPVDADVPQIVVPDTYAAVGKIGAYIREKSSVKVVGITGSVGKTSSKELTACVLGQAFSVLKTEGNFNNELGLPQMLFRLEPYHEVAVLEMGISHFGEMTRLSSTARPDIAIFTNIENVHTEHLIDRDGVLRAKTELVANMRGDLLILNGEDDKLAGYRLPEGKRAVYYGCTDNCSVRAEDIVLHGLQHTTFKMITDIGSIDIDLPAGGRHMVMDALAAAACGIELGIGLDMIKQGIESYQPVGRRMRRFTWHGASIVDDCYNASPASVEASLKVICAEKGRRIAVLGDMLELGEKSAELHRHIGVAAAELGLDMLIAVGEKAAFIAEAAEEAGIKQVYRANCEEAAKLLAETVTEGCTVLIKASRGMELERVINELTKGE